MDAINKIRYKEIINEFNSLNLTDKLKTLRDKKDIFNFEYDNGWCMVTIRNVEDEDFREELNDLISFDGEAFTSSRSMIDLFVMAGIY